MRFCQVKEVLDWVVSFHERLSEEYDRLGDDATKERFSLLLNYLAEHQRMLASTIEKFEIDAADELLNVWSQECPPLELPASLEELHVTLSGKETNAIVNEAIKFHDELIRAYRELEGAAEIDSVRDLFTNLASLEQNEQMRMVRDAQYLNDL